MSEDDTKKATGVPKKPRGLGRGLEALFEDEEGVYPQVSPQGQPAASDGRKVLDISLIERNPEQPRRKFDEESLKELADSIRKHGILQPILVRPKPGEPDKYQIIAGERRWRAAQLAQLHEVPVVIQDLDDIETVEVALVENLQREDLNVLEEGEGYAKLIEQHGYTQERVASVIGKSRPHVANTLRLLTLPLAVQLLVREDKITAGHARALIGTKDPIGLAYKAMNEGLTVRQIEAMAGEDNVKYKGMEGAAGKKGGAHKTKDVDTLALEQEVSNALGMKVTIDVKSGGGGALRIDFASLDQLDDVLHRLSHFPGRRQGG